MYLHHILLKALNISIQYYNLKMSKENWGVMVVGILRPEEERKIDIKFL